MYYCFLKKVFNLSTLLQEYGDSLNCQAGCSKETGSKDRYNNRSYESFVKNGFADAIPRSISGPHDRMQKFLSIVDLRKGEIERSSVRLRAPDWNSSQRRMKDENSSTMQKTGWEFQLLSGDKTDILKADIQKL